MGVDGRGWVWMGVDGCEWNLMRPDPVLAMLTNFENTYL